MPFITDLTYESPIKDYEFLNEESILGLIEDVKSSLASVDGENSNLTLKQVVEIIDKNKYSFNVGNVTTNVDLISAKTWLDAYRDGSEGGCRSCLSRESHRLDPYDKMFFDFCKLKEESLSQAQRVHGNGNGYSSIVKKHYNNPCEEWDPRFDKTLAELIE